MVKTYYGPKTIEEAQAVILKYELRIKKRPDSALRYEAHIRQAKRVIRMIESGAEFDSTKQDFVI